MKAEKNSWYENWLHGERNAVKEEQTIFFSIPDLSDPEKGGFIMNYFGKCGKVYPIDFVYDQSRVSTFLIPFSQNPEGRI